MKLFSIPQYNEPFSLTPAQAKSAKTIAMCSTREGALADFFKAKGFTATPRVASLQAHVEEWQYRMCEEAGVNNIAQLQNAYQQAEQYGLVSIKSDKLANFIAKYR